jgi:hypothetical protein
MDNKKKNLNALKKLCIKLGRKPTHREINNCSYTPTKGYYIWHYGCMEKAFKLINCSFFKTKEENKKKKLIEEFYRIKNKLKRVPLSKDWQKNAKHDICSIYTEFGSWVNFLKFLNETSIYKIPICFKNKKRKFISNDGHICYSKREKEIDDILYSLNLKHENEAYYPKHEKYNRYGRKRCDWKIENVYVEYAGMLAYYDIDVRDKYRKRLEEKINLCLDLGLDFCILMPDNLKTIKSDIVQFFKPILR